MLSNILCWMPISPENLKNKKKKERSMGHPLKQAYICIGIDMLQHQQSATYNTDVEQHALLDAHFTGKFEEPKKKKRSMGHPLKQAYICIGIDMLQHQQSSTYNIDVEQHSLLDAHFTA